MAYSRSASQAKAKKGGIFMKRTLSILIILLLCFSIFVGCEKQEDKEKFTQLLDVLDEIQDVQNVYHNVEL